MKNIIFAFILLAASAFAGPCISSWYPWGNSSTQVWQLTQGAFTSPSTASSFQVNVHTKGATDTATFYLTDANGVAASDVVTVSGGSSAYAMAGGIKRRWGLSGAWRLVLTKAVGTITADVCP